ncbi:hypothetical protein BFC20_10595 [Brochothrix thermosphacta]|uniref:hypothetical protein n=1 Tax=Brochothrix thermosphacta TaxID=2756 RepID=UPI000E736CAF|nr:hypothetical protein [Brochothrix thermosphacta]ANZ98122.1 hypothetical protein BFC20_10595 [Brochothrix thermosphacta]
MTAKQTKSKQPKAKQSTKPNTPNAKPNTQQTNYPYINNLIDLQKEKSLDAIVSMIDSIFSAYSVRADEAATILAVTMRGVATTPHNIQLTQTFIEEQTGVRKHVDDITMADIALLQEELVKLYFSKQPAQPTDTPQQPNQSKHNQSNAN